MSHEALDSDTAATLARLERGEATANPVRLAWEPATVTEAVRAWLAGRGIRKGLSRTPPTAVLVTHLAAYAREAGWGCEAPSERSLATVLRLLGFRQRASAGWYGWLVDAESAAALRLGWKPPRRKRVRRKPRVRRKRATPPPWPPPADAMPVADVRGRVWPSARTAARALRCCHVNVQQAAKYGQRTATGTWWRYLSPAEVASLPPTYRPGTPVPALAWARTVAARVDAACARCGYVGGGDAGRGLEAAPGAGTTPTPTPGFPTTPSHGAQRGDPPAYASPIFDE